MRTDRYFADLSQNNAQADLAAYAGAGHLVVALKATEGVGFTDRRHAERADRAHRLGLVVVHYHFARPDNHESPTDEASFFLAQVNQHFARGDLLAWDQEVKTPNLSWAHLARYARQAHSVFARDVHPNVLLYSYEEYLRSLGPTVPWPSSRVWLADYLRLRRPVLGLKPWAHQFTDGVHGPGPHSAAGVGTCDLSTLSGRAVRWLRRRRKHRP